MPGDATWCEPLNLTALDVARAYLGAHERAGELDNPLILSWLELCAIEDPQDEIPWCSAQYG